MPTSLPPQNALEGISLVTICHCRCGYTCAGPGICELHMLDPLSCFEQHYRQDCGHNFGNQLRRFTRLRQHEIAPACAKCGMSLSAHDEACGP